MLVNETAAYFGCVVTDIQGHWSGISPEGDAPSGYIFLWADADHGWMHAGPDKLVIDSRSHPYPEWWMYKHGNSKRRRDLAFIRDRCNSLFHVAWFWAKDPDAIDCEVRDRGTRSRPHHEADLRSQWPRALRRGECGRMGRVIPEHSVGPVDAAYTAA